MIGCIKKNVKFLVSILERKSNQYRTHIRTINVFLEIQLIDFSVAWNKLWVSSDYDVR